jgi:prolyl-tRNA editing enzyme YbaK/EbsC (Cys-tRNA(Pro) deacylase)
MTPEIMRQYLAAHAPELEVVELPEAHTTEYISREWKVLPAQVAKTLTLRVGEDAIIVVTCGDSRLDNRKVKEELGGKGHMMPGSEASEITGHSVGAITPLCLGSLLPVFFDIELKRFEEVVTAGGSTHAAIRIPLTRFAELTGDVCRCLQRDVSQWRTGSNDSSIAHVAATSSSPASGRGISCSLDSCTRTLGYFSVSARIGSISVPSARAYEIPMRKRP